MADRSWLSRTELLIGKEKLQALEHKHVLVIGLGGVGSYAAEFIARGGVGQMTIVDGDVVDPTNRNRQLPVLATNHGDPKALIMKERLLSINPDLNLRVVQSFIMPEMVEELLSIKYDYVIEAIDSITPKIMVLTTAYEKKQNIVSSMGAGGKFDPTRLRVTDISETHTCRLAKYVRKRLHRKGVFTGIKAVFSDEHIVKESLIKTDGTNFKKSAYGTISYLPATFGATCASVVLRALSGQKV
ncbi:MAG: ThiF family adenylyltransferase [Bacteroidota bacterium]